MDTLRNDDDQCRDSTSSQSRKKARIEPAGVGEKKADRSCAECRRLKLKCSREWPCTNCVKRSCAALCPNDTLKKDPIDQTALLQHASSLFSYLDDVENVVREHGLPLPTTHSQRPRSVSHLMELCSSSATSGSSQAIPGQSITAVPLRNSSSLPDPTSKASPHVTFSALDHASMAGPSASFSWAGFHLQETTSAAQKGEQKRAQSINAVADQTYDQNGQIHPELSRGPESSFGPREGSTRQRHSVEGIHQSDKHGVRGYGTLVISESGTSKYVGHSAGSEWLNSLGETDRSNKVERDGLSTSKYESKEALRQQQKTYPFAMSSILGAQAALLSPSQRHQLLNSLATQLPPKREALATIEWYFKHSSWMFQIIRKSKLHSVMDITYSRMSRVQPGSESAAAGHHRSGHRSSVRQIRGDDLALIFSLLALGAWFDTSLTLKDSSQTSMHWFHASQAALSVSSCVTSPSSVGVQVLHLTALYVLHSQHVKGGDLAWPLLGLCLRMTQSMGMHVDGEAWDLDPEQLNERRRQFWETYSHDTFTAICFGRPGSLFAHEYNCKFPLEEEAQPPSYGDDVDEDGNQSFADPFPAVGYYTLKFRLARIARRMLSEVFGVKTPRYRDVLAFDGELRRFDEQLPYFIRCRVSDNATYFFGRAGQQSARSSPELKAERFRLTIHQHDLASCIIQLRYFLHRKPFADAIVMNPENPLRTPYAASFVAALESSAQLIAIAESLFHLYPRVLLRHSSFWYHSFSASVLCAFCCFHAPRSQSALMAFAQLTKMCELLEQAKDAPRNEHGLRQLLKLRQRAAETLNKTRENGSQPTQHQQGGHSARKGDAGHTNEDHEAAQAMMGISTRLLRCSEGPITRSNSEEPALPSEHAQSDSSEPSDLRAELGHVLTNPDDVLSKPGDGGDSSLPNVTSVGPHPMQLPQHFFDPTGISQHDLDAFLPMNHTEFLHAGVAQKTGRPDMQADLEQLMAMEDIWMSLGGAGSATDAGGTEPSVGGDVAIDTPEASVGGSDSFFPHNGGGHRSLSFDLPKLDTTNGL